MEISPEIPFSLLSSLRYDHALLSMDWNTRVNGGTPSSFMLLPYHHDRLIAAVREHGWQLPAWTLDDLEKECYAATRVGQDQHGAGPQKVCLENSSYSQRR